MLGVRAFRRHILRLVEFIGPPGSGKTTLMRAVLAAAHGRGSRWIDARLLARRPRLHSPSDRLLAIASRSRSISTLLLGAPDEATVAAALDASATAMSPLLARVGRARTSDDEVLRGLGIRWMLDAIVARALIDQELRNRPSLTIALLDEGLTHPYKLATLGPDPIPPMDVLALVPLPDLLVRFQIPEDVLLGRLRARRDRTPTGPRERSWASESDLVAEVEHLAAAVEAVATLAARRGIPVLTADGTMPLRAAAQDLVARIEMSSGSTE